MKNNIAGFIATVLFVLVCGCQKEDNQVKLTAKVGVSGTSERAIVVVMN